MWRIPWAVMLTEVGLGNSGIETEAIKIYSYSVSPSIVSVDDLDTFKKKFSISNSQKISGNILGTQNNSLKTNAWHLALFPSSISGYYIRLQ